MAYYKLGVPDSMLYELNTVKQLYPIHPQLPEKYYRTGTLYLSKRQFVKAISCIKNSLSLNPNSSAAQMAMRDANYSLLRYGYLL